ncbi:MAG TPA: tetratricopeptide repeat protein, partial [Zeimonas sp.]|nr:tetratricopeptide repeat protein [Zeimonas sp.]
MAFKSPFPAGQRLRAGALALSLCSALAIGPVPAQASDAHGAAIELARGGEHAAALAALERLAAERPEDLGLVFDQVVVLGWAGRDEEALFRAAGLDLARAPAYVLEGIGRSARNLKRFDLAHSVYRRSLDAHPDRTESLTGLALTLSDQGRHAEAARLLDEALAAPGQGIPERAGRRATLLVARATAAEFAGDWVGALSFHQRALQAEPRHREALVGVVRCAARLGAPHLAADIAARHPRLLSDADVAALAGDSTAMQIRWGRIQERIESGDARFAWLDQALARSEPAAAQLAEALARRRAGGVASLDVGTGRLLGDRIVALELRRRPGDAVALYESMLEAGVAVPGYALGSVADALLAIRRPEAAAGLYREVLAVRPDDFEASLGLFFALVESELLDDALAHADALAERTPTWRSPGRANPDAVTARTTPALGRLYGDRLAD